MPEVTVGAGLDDRRAVARASPVRRRGDGVPHDHDVVAVDQLGRDAVRGGAVGGRVVHGGHRGDRRVLHVEVVLADEQHRESPHRGEVERLVEGADVGRPVAEEGDGDLLGAAQHRRPGRPDGHREVGTDDGVRPEHAPLGLGQVHGSALGLAQPGRPAHQFGQTFLRRGPAGHRVVVAAIGGEHVVVRAECRARPHGDCLVTGGEVGRALDQAGHEQVVGGLLRSPDDHHLLVQLEQLARLVAAGVGHQARRDAWPGGGVEVRLRLAQGVEVAGRRPVALAGDEQLLGRELRDHLAPVGGHDELLLDAGRRPAVRRRPVGLQGEDHALLEWLWMVERHEP